MNMQQTEMGFLIELRRVFREYGATVADNQIVLPDGQTIPIHPNFLDFNSSSRFAPWIETWRETGLREAVDQFARNSGINLMRATTAAMAIQRGLRAERQLSPDWCFTGRPYASIPSLPEMSVAVLFWLVDITNGDFLKPHWYLSADFPNYGEAGHKIILDFLRSIGFLE